MGAANEITRHALTITAFVFVMMLVIEYLNVLTSGRWRDQLTRYRWGQYVLAAFLGATPGCLGAFAVVAMYSHGVVRIGAVVAAMVATSGDEAFVMLAVIPKQALFLTGILFAVGIAAGVVTDLVSGWRRAKRLPCCEELEVHAEESCECFPHRQILRQWKECSAARGILAVGLFIFMAALAAGQVGPPAWNWIRVTLLVASGVALFIVSTVPDHFLEEHLWRHVARRHVPRVFLWTLGALVAMYFLTEHLSLGERLHEGVGRWAILVVAALVGLVPESGPHLIFVTLYAKGTIPVSVLLASSIVQDGHGMLPMLAHSRRAFLGIKAINLAAGLLVGAAAMALGF